SAPASLVQLEPIAPDEANYEYPDLNIYVNAYENDQMAYFQFFNETLIASSVAAIYFDEDHFDGVIDIITSEGVAINVDTAKPGELPGASLLDPTFTSSISFGSEKPPAHEGINPGQEMTIIFKLNGSVGAQNWLEDFQTGQLRVGAHVIGLPDGSSYSAVSVPPEGQIPEPATLSILGLGSMFLLKSRKKVYSVVAKTPKQFLMLVLIMLVAFAGNTHAMISDGRLAITQDLDEKPYRITLLDVDQKNDDGAACLKVDSFSIGSSNTLTVSLDRYRISLSDLPNSFETISFISDYSDVMDISKIAIETNMFSLNN
ncbi:MAG: PEP-CTERM sorting domain-containing protein, partial [Planctomycetes bacterium]|nr:PEP-CTERM sorting domain-containing protein [Planctomycetota bacterium]